MCTGVGGEGRVGVIMIALLDKHISFFAEKILFFVGRKKRIFSAW